jgi:hypothetical protein
MAPRPKAPVVVVEEPPSWFATAMARFKALTQAGMALMTLGRVVCVALGFTGGWVVKPSAVMIQVADLPAPVPIAKKKPKPPKETPALGFLDPSTWGQ